MVEHLKEEHWFEASNERSSFLFVRKDGDIFMDQKKYKHVSVRFSEEDWMRLNEIMRDIKGCSTRAEAIRQAINFAYIFTKKKKE